jgi:hypothetical protein
MAKKKDDPTPAEDPTPETAEDVVVDAGPTEPPPVTAEQVALEEAQAKVAEAAKVHADAAAELEAAKAELNAAHLAANPPPPPSELGKHVLVDFGATGDYVQRDAPAGYRGDQPDRVLRVDGVNVEHVDDCPLTGIWRYRRM